MTLRRLRRHQQPQFIQPTPHIGQALALLGARPRLDSYGRLCGAEDVAATAARYAAAGNLASHEVLPYIDDMPAAYAWADLVIARAGASSIAEIAACGVAAILVPYPYAVDDHQTANARYLAGAEAAVLLPETEMSVERLAAEIGRLLKDTSARLAMAERARACGRPHATAEVAAQCLEFVDA